VDTGKKSNANEENNVGIENNNNLREYDFVNNLNIDVVSDYEGMSATEVIFRFDRKTIVKLKKSRSTSIY
jgi:hypothetical protein